ncbi:MAG: hypothetical protein D3924_12990, partial [Candidatus Electrothrix sp. AR4]|nr:hypothetical protein [Candidatus Electrothrix sp. AR4]
MNARILRNIVPALLVCGLCGGMFGAAQVFAEEHGEVLHAESGSVDVVQEQHQVDPHATHDVNAETAAYDESEPAHTAAPAAHTQDTHAQASHTQDPHAVDASHSEEGKEAHGGGHGGGHAAPMVTGAKLWDLLWRALNFAALVFL